MKLIFSPLLVVILAANSVNAEVKVGVILPLSGDFSYFGQEVREGISIAMDELKASGAKVPELIFEDDKCLAKEAVAGFRKLTNEQKVALVLGPACSTSILSVAPIARRSTTPVIFLLDTGESVSTLPDPLYSFGFDPPKMARALAEDLFKRNLKNVATITEEEEYAVLLSKAFEQKWAAMGGQIVASESHPLAGTDFRSTITRILSKKPEAIFYSSAYQSGPFLKQLRIVAPNIPVYGNDTMCTADTIDTAGAAANGARCANVLLDESATAVKAFRSAVETKYKKAPRSLFYAALGYDAVRLMLHELKLPPMPGKPLLGIEVRSQNGIYDISPSIIEIEKGEMVAAKSAP